MFDKASANLFSIMVKVIIGLLMIVNSVAGNCEGEIEHHREIDHEQCANQTHFTCVQNWKCCSRIGQQCIRHQAACVPLEPKMNLSECCTGTGLSDMDLLDCLSLFRNQGHETILSWCSSIPELSTSTPSTPTPTTPSSRPTFSESTTASPTMATPAPTCPTNDRIWSGIQIALEGLIAGLLLLLAWKKIRNLVCKIRSCLQKKKDVVAQGVGGDDRDESKRHSGGPERGNYHYHGVGTSGTDGEGTETETENI